MKEPKSLYNLRYYARKKGYYFDKVKRAVTVPEKGRSPHIEERLKSYNYGIQLNIFG